MKILHFAICLLLAGCATPMAAFTPTTTPDGVNGWRIVYKDYPEEAVQALIQTEMGRTKSCQQGYRQTTKEVTPQGFTIVEGVCK